jgi:hypothetical protein
MDLLEPTKEPQLMELLEAVEKNPVEILDWADALDGV